MSAAGFLSNLNQTGRIRLPGAAQLGALDLPEAELVEVDRQARMQLPGGMPELLLPVARWGATLLHDLVTCYAFRHLEASQIRAVAENPCPDVAHAAAEQVAYAADLALHYLPDLFRLARGIAPGDPLVAALLQVARAWPLSSVGIPEVDADPDLNVSGFIDHVPLRTLYLDRIFAHQALPRLRHVQVRPMARAAIGLFPPLAPEAAAFLETLEVH